MNVDTERPCRDCGATPTVAKSSRCPACLKLRNREYYLAHRELIINTNVAYAKRRAETDPGYAAAQTERRRKYRLAHPDEAEAARRRHRYGLDHDQYVEMFSAQSGRCAICRAPHQKLHIDHDHATGTVRGLLCRSCNHLLGNAKDDPDILVKARLYLLTSRDEP